MIFSPLIVTYDVQSLHRAKCQNKNAMFTHEMNDQLSLRLFLRLRIQFCTILYLQTVFCSTVLLLFLVLRTCRTSFSSHQPHSSHLLWSAHIPLLYNASLTVHWRVFLLLTLKPNIFFRLFFDHFSVFELILSVDFQVFLGDLLPFLIEDLLGSSFLVASFL